MILYRLILAGISLRLSEDGKILAGPREKVTSELAALITANREHLIARIKEEAEDSAARAELERVYPDHTVMSYGAMTPVGVTVTVRLWPKASDDLADMVEATCDLIRTVDDGKPEYHAFPAGTWDRLEAHAMANQTLAQEAQEKKTKKRKKAAKKKEQAHDNNSTPDAFSLGQGTTQAVATDL